VRTKIEAAIKRHNLARARCARVCRRFILKDDYTEAARWADAAKSHRFVTEVLKELIGHDHRTDRR
jgi:hypothetical protein